MVPSITVPNTFTWAIQIGQATPVAAGLPIFGSPTVGSYDSNWFEGPGSWTHAGGITNSYLARITATSAAVPEPSSVVIAGVGALGMIGAWVRRRRVAA